MTELKFLAQLPRFLFFTGNGGVGKTSVACATAIQLAESGRRVLLVSTDPASNVGQVFGITIGNQITAITAVTGLAALEIDPQAAAQAYRDRIVGPVRGLLPDAVVKGIEEQLSGACTTEIAAFDEFTALLVNSVLTSDYDHIIFDTAPTGHTLLLLDATDAYHREVTRQLGDSGMHYLTPMMQLQSPKQTKVLLVSSRKPRRYWKRPACKPICAVPELNLGRGWSTTASLPQRYIRRYCDNVPPTSYRK